jgi:hypothetical protein
MFLGHLVRTYCLLNRFHNSYLTYRDTSLNDVLQTKRRAFPNTTSPGEILYHIVPQNDRSPSLLIPAVLFCGIILKQP